MTLDSELEKLEFQFANLEEEIWASNPFMIVITEWIKEVPLYPFESIGQYLIFMKSIYFGINDISIQVLEKSNSLEKQTLLELDAKATSFTLKGWKFLYPYFVYKGFNVLNIKRLNEDPYSII